MKKFKITEMKNTKIIIIIATLIFGIAGCNSDDFFEVERPPQAPWSTVQELDRPVVGAYSQIFYGPPLGNWNMAWIAFDIPKLSAGDDIGYTGDPSQGYYRESKEFNEYTQGPSDYWRYFYLAISTANDALAFLESNDGNPFPGADDTELMNINRVKGELHFIRGYAYYYLQTVYGHAYVPGGENSIQDIPLITKFASSEVEAKTPKIGTTAEVFELIKSDFVIAKELIPSKYDASTMPESFSVRGNKFAAAAMLAKTLFLMGDYDAALAEYNFVIDQNGGEYDLSEDPIEAWNKSSLDRGKEVIFYLPYFSDGSLYPARLTFFGHSAPWGGQVNWNIAVMGDKTVQRLGWMDDPVNDTTINLTAKADKRFQQLYAVRYPADLAQEGQATDPRDLLSGKTTVWTDKYFRGPKLSLTNVPKIRLAEMYLSRAVLRLRAGNKDGAAADLNVVRQRAWDESIGGAFVPVTASEITEQMINDERIREMFGEADRLDYLRSLKVDVPNGERDAGSTPYTSEDFVWKIPG